MIYFRYFASGYIQRHMPSLCRIIKQHLGIIIDEVCDAICETLKSQQLEKENYLEIANKYNSKWNSPNCNVDGKNFGIKCPNNAGSLFFNYKTLEHMLMKAMQVYLLIADLDNIY